MKIVSIELEFERFVLRAVSAKRCSVNILKLPAYKETASFPKSYDCSA